MNIDTVIQGDCREVLKTLPDQSINCCVTSPPYYGLRDYGMSEQIGLEQTAEEFIQELTDVFREVKRVLTDDGTLWLNIGDSYAGNCSRTSTGRCGMGLEREGIFSRKDAKPKDLIGIPWMLAFALRNDGWYLRQDIIWHKPNPMPESVTDRCTKSHEYIFLLSKKPKYYFDHEAIQEESVSDPNRYKYPMMAGEKEQSGQGRPNASANTGGMKEWTGMRNKRDVWSVTTKPCREAHFATFPEDLIEPCILAGCPIGGGSN